MNVSMVSSLHAAFAVQNTTGSPVQRHSSKHQMLNAASPGPQTTPTRRRRAAIVPSPLDRARQHKAIANATKTTAPFGRANVATAPASPAARSRRSFKNTNAHVDPARNNEDG